MASLLGAGLVAYRYYSKPVTLSLAVGSFDGEATKIASIIAGRLDAAKSAVRVDVVPTDSVLDSAKMFAAGKADMAIVRADVGDLSQARSVVQVNKSVLMILAPGTALTSIEKLKGHTVGVVGGEINQRIVDALKKEYDLADKVTFKNIAAGGYAARDPVERSQRVPGGRAPQREIPVAGAPLLPRRP